VRPARLVPRHSAAVVVAALGCLLVAEVAWGRHKTPELYSGEPATRIAARHEAAAWLARTTRPDDLVLGYEPLFLEAWERGGRIPRSVVPRADAKLALRALEGVHHPLGRGVWVFDASDTGNAERVLTIPLRSPQPRSAYDVMRFGPFLIVRTRGRTGTIRRYLKLARRAELLGKSLDIGDAGVNLDTVLAAERRYERERPASASRSTVSR